MHHRVDPRVLFDGAREQGVDGPVVPHVGGDGRDGLRTTNDALQPGAFQGRLRPVRRVDEVKAAKNPVVRYLFDEHPTRVQERAEATIES